LGAFVAFGVHPLTLVLGLGVSVSAHHLSPWSCCAWVAFFELLFLFLASKKVREARFFECHCCRTRSGDNA